MESMNCQLILPWLSYIITYYSRIMQNNCSHEGHSRKMLDNSKYCFVGDPKLFLCNQKLGESSSLVFDTRGTSRVYNLGNPEVSVATGYWSMLKLYLYRDSSLIAVLTTSKKTGLGMFLQQHENKQTITMYDWSSPRPRLAHKWVSEAQHWTLVPWDIWLVDVGWFVLPSGKLTWLAGKSHFQLGNTSSKGPFSIARYFRLIYLEVTNTQTWTL